VCRRLVRTSGSLRDTPAGIVAPRLSVGRRFRTLDVLDGAGREALDIQVGTSIPSQRSIRTSEQLIEVHGQPSALRPDRGASRPRGAQL